jgi:hypothetical protein
MVRQLAPTAQIWAGEDGPIGGGEDGTCGDKFPNGSLTNTSVCGTYATVPWYANDLALRAVYGFSQYQRQDLVGGRYGLLGVEHDNEMLGAKSAVRLNPDFWVNFLWKRVMGNTVFNLTAVAGTKLDADVRAYGHCGTPPSKHVPGAVKSAKRPMGLVLININTTKPKLVQFGAETSGSVYTVWTLSAGAEGVFGEITLLNGQPLQQSISDGVAIGDIPVAGQQKNGEVALPPFSVTFAVTECPP